MVEENAISVNGDKVKEWVKKGAKLTDTAAALVKKAGIEM